MRRALKTLWRERHSTKTVLVKPYQLILSGCVCIELTVFSNELNSLKEFSRPNSHRRRCNNVWKLTEKVYNGRNEWPGTYTVRSIINHVVKRLPISELTFVEGSLYVARKSIAKSSIKPGKLCEVELHAGEWFVRPLFATRYDLDRKHVTIQQGKHYHSLIPVRPSVYDIYPEAAVEAVRRRVSLQDAVNSTDEDEDD